MTHRVRICLLAWLSMATADWPLLAQDPVPPTAVQPTAAQPTADQPIEAVIDHYIALEIAKAGVSPATQADDSTLIRRLTLDLAGRIPTAAEAQAFVQSTHPTKWQQTVD